jgi:hypothetical protein
LCPSFIVRNQFSYPYRKQRTASVV